MEVDMEKLVTNESKSEETIQPSSVSLLVSEDDNQSCRMNLPMKRGVQDDHEEEEMNPSPKEVVELPNLGSHSHSLRKTSLCSYFRRPTGGGCRHGDACRYAHGEAELQPRLDNSWDPTSARFKKVVKSNDDVVSGLAEEDEADAVDLADLSKCLIGLPVKWDSGKLSRFLDDKGITYKTAKKKNGMAVGFVTFSNAEEIRNAIEVLKLSLLNCKQVKIADAVHKSEKKKQKMDANLCPLSVEDDTPFSSSNIEGIAANTKDIRDVVTPLALMPYEDQLEHKRTSLLHTLKRLTRNARKACRGHAALPAWIVKSSEIGGLPCKLEGILESPLVDGYRNKCEFSIGYSLEGKLTVGFKLGNFREGVMAVEEPGNCLNVSRISLKYVMLFQEFLQSSELPVWNSADNTGFWRQFTVREGRCSTQVTFNGSVEIAEVMLIIQVNLLGRDEEQISSEFNRMTDALANGSAACSPPLPLTAIVVQDHRGISNAAPADCHLITLELPGLCDSRPAVTTEARIHDYIANLRFSISPMAFFQVNTLAAERLFSLVGEWADLSPHTILFDICCGTGTIGLTLAHHVGMVVGVEMNESAVLDANRNAEINGITNCRFICGKAEDVIGSILKEYLDPPQHHGVVSDVPGRNSSPIASNESDKKNCNQEDFQDDDLVSETEPMLPCLGDSSMEKIAINDDVQQSSEQPLNDANYSDVHQSKRVVAIVDPPRAGLHPIVIKALRTHPQIRRLVYISCNPETLVANAIELCTPTGDKQEKGKGNKGWWKKSSASLARHRVKSMPASEAFQPVRAMGVDLFPHTDHCEMVMLLER